MTNSSTPGAKSPMLLWLSLLTLVATVILIGLGSWQWQRLNWKEDLIRKIENRATGSEHNLSEVQSFWNRDRDVEFYRIRVRGTFDHTKELHFYALDAGRPGWRIVAPLELPDATLVFVDRGFVPLELKSATARTEGQISGKSDITGIVREYEAERGLFVPANDLARNEWYWRSQLEMSEASLEPAKRDKVLPFLIESDDLKLAGGWPKGGVTRLSLPNRHFQYALTWWGLALTLIVVYGVFVRGQLRKTK